MAQATSISLSKFTGSVQASVQAAIAKHPKFQAEANQPITVSYLIRGIPAVDSVLKAVTVSELQAFANEVAAGIAVGHPEAFSTTGPHGTKTGAIISVGGHVVIGIPPVTSPLEIAP